MEAPGGTVRTRSADHRHKRWFRNLRHQRISDIRCAVLLVYPAPSASPISPTNRFTALPAELSTAHAARKVIADVTAKWGCIDGLVHLIGAFVGGSSLADTDDATLDRMLDLNFRSTFHIVRAVLPRMRRQGGGRIAAIGSKAAMEPQALSGRLRGIESGAGIAHSQCCKGKRRWRYFDKCSISRHDGHSRKPHSNARRGFFQMG